MVQTKQELVKQLLNDKKALTMPCATCSYAFSCYTGQGTCDEQIAWQRKFNEYALILGPEITAYLNRIVKYNETIATAQAKCEAEKKQLLEMLGE